MSKPLKLFIAPPYNGISLVHSYGQGQNQIQNINIFHNTIALLTSGSGALRATSDGLLSICSPGTNVVDPREEIVLSDNQVLPESVTLYLHIDPIVRVFPSLSQGQQAIWNSVTLVGFAFLNVETSSLGNILSVPLQKSILPKSLNANDKLNVFLSGGTNLIIKSGDTIGIAAKDTTDNTKRMLEFAVLTKDGTIDPAFFYHHMSDFCE